MYIYIYLCILRVFVRRISRVGIGTRPIAYHIKPITTAPWPPPMSRVRQDVVIVIIIKIILILFTTLSCAHKNRLFFSLSQVTLLDVALVKYCTFVPITTCILSIKKFLFFGTLSRTTHPDGCRRVVHGCRRVRIPSSASHPVA